uniref:Small ribosomal subunit protein uS17c n=1 Tax=Trichogloeopsis pedicellata TaxID=1495610 RepID=A0A1G4P0N1_9FLOR|nr:Ribosomal protein S17 [Trichogloeopsis pedicellata]SCW24455.1 Ribosomal protein S17 [Trichogloeopsis pedicellata]
MTAKEKVGIVVSNKMIKTVTVAVRTRIPHKKYSKILARTKKYKVHDEHNMCQVGDIVKIRETRPLSKTKCWTLMQKVGKLYSF